MIDVYRIKYVLKKILNLKYMNLVFLKYKFWVKYFKFFLIVLSFYLNKLNILYVYFVLFVSVKNVNWYVNVKSVILIVNRI